MVDQESIRTVPLFAGLEEQDLNALSKLVELADYEKGTFLFDEATQEPSLYIIKEGAIRLSERVRGGRGQTLAVLHAPEFLGEISLLDGGPALASAQVIRNSRLWVISKPAFERFLESNPQGGYLILKGLASNICATLRRMDEQFIDMIKFVWEMGAKI